jgi:hypothetical protein
MNALADDQPHWCATVVTGVRSASSTGARCTQPQLDAPQAIRRLDLPHLNRESMIGAAVGTGGKVGGGRPPCPGETGGAEPVTRCGAWAALPIT